MNDNANTLMEDNDLSENKSGKNVLIPILIILVLIALGVCAFAMFTSTQNQKQEAQNQGSSAQQKTQEEEVELDESDELTPGETDLSTHLGDVALKQAGDYTLTGELQNGAVIIDSDGEVNVKFSNTTISNGDTSGIIVLKASSAKLDFVGQNSVSDGGYSQYDGAIFSAIPLNITMSEGGSLKVYGNQEDGEGIATKNQPITIDASNGEIYVESEDDGINIGGDGALLKIISGNITINAGGDGIDSNDSAEIDGGTIIVFGSAAGGNAAIDTDNGYTINGGRVYAFGSDMLEEPQKSSTQTTAIFQFESAGEKGESFKIETNNGTTEITTLQGYKNLIISEPNLSSTKLSYDNKDISIDGVTNFEISRANYYFGQDNKDRNEPKQR